MSIKYKKEFLISELQRFKNENNRIPKTIDMQGKFGYPSYVTYIEHFGSWNNVLMKVFAKINRTHFKITGEETCDKCGNLKKHQWRYKNGQRLCFNCYYIRDYMNGNLDPNSKVGFGFIGQRIVAKTLGLDLEHDCNCSQGFGSEYDLYDVNKYKYINVKASTLGNDNAWHFTLKNKYIPDTYIMLGFSSDKSDIEHVWITKSTDKLIYDNKNSIYKISITIRNTDYSLKRAESWEVDCKSYNDAYHNMSLENCSVLRSN